MDILTVAVLVLGGSLAGFIDSIAGGGGLITLPLLGFFLGPGVAAIASNKIVGLTGAAVALFVYTRAGHLKWREGLSYVLCVGVGSVAGSLLTPRLPIEALRVAILVACSLITLMVVTKHKWWPHEARREQRAARPVALLLLASLLVGVYDGAIGPGGGTFMLLVLLLFSRFTLLQSMALSKLANSASAGFSLVSYALQGHVHVFYGAIVALGMAGGAYLGAHLALKRAEQFIRPLLLVVSALLLWRLSRS